MYAQGAADAREDDEIITRCPPGDPLGPRHPEGYPYNLYHRGYADTYVGDPHVCTGRCREDDDQ